MDRDEKNKSGETPTKPVSRVKQLIDQFERSMYQEETPKLMMAGVRRADIDELTYEDVFEDPFGEEKKDFP